MSVLWPDGQACRTVQAFHQKLQGDLGAVFPPAAFTTATVSGIALSSSAAGRYSMMDSIVTVAAIQGLFLRKF